MKVWFKCYKCGEPFEAEERVRTDICPHCMSFVDLSRAERLVGKPDVEMRSAAAEDAAVPSSKANSPSAAQSVRNGNPALAAGAVSPVQGIVSRASEPSAVGAEDTYDSLYARAEKMLTFGAWGNAAELFKQCLEKQESWQARFGLVRAATRELTDLSSFDDVQKDADAAFDGMDAAERTALGKRYVPKLEEKRRSLCCSLDALSAAGTAAAQFAPVPRNDLLLTAESNLSPSQQGKKGGGAGFLVFGVLWLLVFVVAGILLFSVQSLAGVILLILGVVGGMSCIAIGARKMAVASRARAAKEAVRAVTEQTRNAERAKLQAQIDAVDYLCGFLKY